MNYDLANLIVNSLTALGTVGAVITSLYIAHKNSRPIISAYVSKSVIIQPQPGQDKIKLANLPRAITVTIYNKSAFVTKIGYFSFTWHVIFSKNAAIQNPITDFRRPGHLEVPSFSSTSIQLTDMPSMREVIAHFKSNSKLPALFHKFRLKRIKLIIYTNDGQAISAAIEKKLLNELLAE